MKTIILVDVNTDRTERPVVIGKPPEITPPATPDEASVMITTDIACLCESLCVLITMADQNKYADKKGLIEASINRLNLLLKEETPQPTTVSGETTSL